MQGDLKVARRRPHFLMITLSLVLEEGMDNLELSRRIESSLTIRQMRKDTEAGRYILDYYVPLHTIVTDSSYLVDDMVEVEQFVPGQDHPKVLANIRISFDKTHKFLCASNIRLSITEYDWNGNIIPRP